MFIYVLLLFFFILPVTVLAYVRIRANRYPLPYFSNNVVVSRIKLRKAFGVLSPIAFWCLHGFLLVAAIEQEAWLAVLVFMAYMVASLLLSVEIKAKGVGLTPEVAGATRPAAALAPSDARDSRHDAPNNNPQELP